jgi:hypothetical protein
MITKYTRKQINQQARLHNLDFVTANDCEAILQEVILAAINAGADESKLIGGATNDNLSAH